MTQEAHIAQLAVKHITGTLSEPELAELTQWLEASPEHRHLFDAYTHPDFISKEYKNRIDRKERLETRIGNLSSAGAEGYRDSPEQVSDLYPENIPVVHRVHFLKTSWFRYAAAAVLLLGGAAIWREASRSSRKEGGAETTVAKNQDIQPGSNKAILTVGDNKPVDLASDKSGVAIGNTTTYIDGSSIEGLAGNHQRITINTLATPRGGQYQAVLPDGSKVWLNAASSIRFPSKFTGEERSVEVSGEVYIEVKQNARQPFLVHTNKTTIQVLGTGFNINTYEDEAAERTTLVEGSVRVKGTGDVQNDNAGVLLQPGQQSSYNSQSQRISVQGADLEQTLAWKNGMFQFKGATIQEVMRQLSRWYDVEVSYEGKIPATRFDGEMQRDLPLASALRILELSKVHLKIDGKKIIVMP